MVIVQEYGPYYRVQTGTQTDETAQAQIRSEEIWGLPHRFGGVEPQVKAYVGPLPPDKKGVEFYTNVPPDYGCPPGVHYWTPKKGKLGVWEEDDYAKIKVRITKCTQS